MKKILVTYFSLTGNTKKISEAIYEVLPEEKVLLPVEDVQDFDQYRLIFLGFPVHSHSVPIKVEAFLKRIPQGKKLALFSTHGSLTGSRLSREALEYAVVLAAKTNILGTFSCRGKVSSQALEVLMKSPEHKMWTEMAASAYAHPDQEDIKEAKVFARWIMSLYAESSG